VVQTGGGIKRKQYGVKALIPKTVPRLSEKIML
jgi:hypothetical protein